MILVWAAATDGWVGERVAFCLAGRESCKHKHPRGGGCAPDINRVQREPWKEIHQLCVGVPRKVSQVQAHRGVLVQGLS